MRRIATALLLALTVATFAAAQMTTTGPDAELPLRVIVVGTEAEAREVAARLTRGEPFAPLAQEVSLDPTAADGGRLGMQPLAGLRPEIREALAGVAEGAWTAVIPVPTGFALLLRAPSDDAAVRRGAAVRSAALAASGSVKYVNDIGGYGASNAILAQFAKPRDWNMDPATICRMRTESLAATESSLAGEVATAVRRQVKPFELVQLHFLQGQLHAYHGRMAEAIAAYERAYSVAADRVPDATPEILEALGVVHLHKAGLDNRLHHAPGDRCLLAVRDRAPLADPYHARQAVGYFTNFLTRQRDSLEVRWLLNLAHMAAGSYPQGVPASLVIPPAAFESAEEVGRFVDVATAAGLSSFASAGGVIVDDFDRDGRFDVATSSMNSCEPMRLFTRSAGGRFAEQSAGLATQLGGLSMVQGDYDNDGDPDILLLRGAWELPQRKSLLRNDGRGTFTDVTVASGIAAPATSTQAAVWTDVDRDGFLDLFIANETQPAQLFRNRGNGTFDDVAARAGVNRTAFSKTVSAADYDNDGWPDLHVSNLGDVDFLYRNNRDGTFTETGGAARVPGTGSGFASWFFDYDNDGWEDLFVTSFITSLEETARTYLGLPNNARPLKLYRNSGTGQFEDATRRAGLDKVFMPMGANYGDIDNDGYLDIYLGTGNPSYASLVPSVLLRNRDGASFADVTASSGTGELHKGHGVAFADLDRDGDQDLIFEVGGATPADRHLLRLFENPGHGNDWLSVTLTGVRTNRSGVGARIAVTVEAAGRRRTVHRTVGSGGSFGSAPLEQHIGLGRGARIVAVDVWWPVSDTRQRFTDVAANQSIGITELGDTFVRLERPRQPLGWR